MKQAKQQLPSPPHGQRWRLPLPCTSLHLSLLGHWQTLALVSHPPCTPSAMGQHADCPRCSAGGECWVQPGGLAGSGRGAACCAQCPRQGSGWRPAPAAAPLALPDGINCHSSSLPALFFPLRLAAQGASARWGAVGGQGASQPSQAVHKPRIPMRRRPLPAGPAALLSLPPPVSRLPILPRRTSIAFWYTLRPRLRPSLRAR